MGRKAAWGRSSRARCSWKDGDGGDPAHRAGPYPNPSRRPPSRVIPVPPHLLHEHPLREWGRAPGGADSRSIEEADTSAHSQGDQAPRGWDLRGKEEVLAHRVRASGTKNVFVAGYQIVFAVNDNDNGAGGGAGAGAPMSWGGGTAARGGQDRTGPGALRGVAGRVWSGSAP